MDCFTSLSNTHIFLSAINIMWGRLFGGSDKEKGAPAPPPPSNGGSTRGVTNAAAQMERLDGTIELLEKRVAVLEKKLEQEIEKAKECMKRNNKNAAMQCMKRKKIYEEQISQQMAQMHNLETMKFRMQEATMNKHFLDAQRAATHELHLLNKEMDADKVADERERMQEIFDQQRDVTAALTEPIDGDPIDEDELLGDLADLMALDEMQAAEAQAVKVAPQRQKTAEVALPDMPNVPSKPLPSTAVTNDEEEALRALEAELNS